MMNNKHKKAFSMITAIFVIVIMATVSSLIMNVTGKTIKSTTQQYQKEQAAILARSYTELAIFKVLYQERNATSCLTTFSENFGAETDFHGYDITVNIQYLGNNTLLSSCTASAITTWANNINGFDKSISLLIDTYISYKDFDDPSDRNITFHRRTLQKL